MTTSLTDRMAEVLRDVDNVSDIMARARAYHVAGLELHTFTQEDVRLADEAAASTELIKRMDGHHDHGA